MRPREDQTKGDKVEPRETTLSQDRHRQYQAKREDIEPQGKHQD